MMASGRLQDLAKTHPRERFVLFRDDLTTPFEGVLPREHGVVSVLSASRAASSVAVIKR